MTLGFLVFAWLAGKVLDTLTKQTPARHPSTGRPLHRAPGAGRRPTEHHASPWPERRATHAVIPQVPTHRAHAPVPSPVVTIPASDTRPATSAVPLLRPGSSGNSVKILQQHLLALGFSKVVPDGKFGPITEAAVLAFQGAHAPSLTVDGIVGPATWRAILAASPAPTIPARTAPAPAVSPPPGFDPISRGPTVPTSSQAPATAATALPYLRQGSTGPDVALVQRQLGVTADGKFGPGTRAAVVAFQHTHGLAPDGIVGPQTWTALLGQAA